jgi:hypothetical protein
MFAWRMYVQILMISDILAPSNLRRRVIFCAPVLEATLLALTRVRGGNIYTLCTQARVEVHVGPAVTGSPLRNALKNHKT